MSATSDNGLEIDAIMEKDIGEMTRADCRLRIAREVGLNKDMNTPFGKRHLLSIYWYVTGSTPCPKKIIGTQGSPHIGSLRAKIAHEIDQRLEDSEFTSEYEYDYQIPQEERTTTPLPLETLQAIVDYVSTERDKRPRPGED